MKRFTIALLVAIAGALGHHQAMAQTMNSYTAYPPFINKAVPPAVMLMMTKDHRLFFKGYNDIVDLDNGKPGGDAAVDTTYKDNIDYVGYFDSMKCYDYASSGGAGFANTGRFNASAVGTGTYGHACAGNWSGNFMNWATMARIDIIRKVLYGGRRIVDNAGSSTLPLSGNNGLTVLGRTITPRDAHAWAKVYQAADVGSFVPSGFTSGNAITICNTNSASTETVGFMMVLNGYFPNAASTEVTQCSPGAGSFVAGDVVATYRVAVKVCDWTAVGLEANCDAYYDNNTPGPTNTYTYKPQGLLQRMAVNANGSAGTLDDTITMRFGLISGSYERNFSGGVLRSKPTDLYSQEINRRTGQISSTSKVIKAIDMFRVVGYNFGSSNYSVGGNDGNCQVSGGVPVEGDCKSWGEPFAEMFYEAIRYFRGLTATGNATTQFYKTTGSGPDNSITSFAIGSGTYASSTFPIETNSGYGDPYITAPLICEYCAKPFVLMLGDAFPSHDSDQLPGAQAWSSAPSQVNPTTNDTGLDLATLLAASSMNTLDPISSVVMGEVNGGAANSICSAKATTTYLNIRGLCPEEPNKYGSFYLPMLAHYAKTTDLRGALGNDTTNTVKQNITTYAVVASAPVPVLELTVGTNKVQLTPAFHSGCPDRQANAPASDPRKYWGCQAWGGNSTNTTPLSLNGAGLGAWGTNGPVGPIPSTSSAHIGGNKGQLVSFDVCANDDDVTPPIVMGDWQNERVNNGYTSCYEIQWDDATYGGDYDLDIRYRLYVKTGLTTITVKTKPMYASSGNGNWAGFYINGVSAAGHTATTPAGSLPNILTGSGEYYDIRCGNNLPIPDASGYPTPANNGRECQAYDRTSNWGAVATDPYTGLWVERTFTVNGSNAGLLKDPLWYASKYGGFKDTDKPATTGYNLPDKTAEWDLNGDGTPETYFLAQNPLELQGKLAAAFAAILNQTSSGTAASVLSSSTSGEGAIYQSYFYPTQFEAEREIKYAGYVQSLFIDTYGNFREDTVKDNRLVLNEDRIVVTRYDAVNDRLAIDVYVDSNGDGQADPTRDTSVPLDGILDTAFCDDAPHQCDKVLTDINPIWEGGRNLALMNPVNRKIFTWVDLDNNKLVSNLTPPTGAPGEEYVSFDSTNATMLTGYLNLSGAPAAYTAANIISFIRGTQVTGLRDRTLTVKDSSGTPVSAVWKLGDSVYSTPVVVGAPRERYDILYGDSTYTPFYSQYKNRRQVAYLGANDGMMHAFNVGFYHEGDDPAGPPGKTERGWFDNVPTVDGRGVNIGDELWGFIPQELLPHLRWLADPAYTHVYYVDLKPKVTDVRIFPNDADHPGGWGTILIGGFRMGGSCGNCTTQGTPMTFAGNFDNVAGVDAARTFLSAYFVLDVTNPDKVPTLLWSYSDQNLGFAMSYPAVARVSPLTDPTKYLDTNEKWFMVVGSGPTSYDAGVGQTGKMFAINMKARMTSIASGVVTIFDASGGGATPPNSFVGDMSSFDRDLDYRADVMFAGKVISATPWEGKLIRLTTGCWKNSSPVCNTDAGLWGVPSGVAGVQAPSEILYQFLDGGGVTRTLGPVPTSIGVTIDATGNTWVFAGTGRYYTQTSGTGDKIDTSIQYLVGIKDSVMQGSGGCAGGDVTITGCRLNATLSNELIDMSTSTICQLGTGTCDGTTTTQVTSVPAMPTGGTYASLIALVQSKQGWFSKLTVPAGGFPSERSVANPVLLGGIVFFPTFTPSGDVCVAAGSSNLYALYYVTGGAYSSPIVGMTGQNINKKVFLGEGMATTVAIHLGAQDPSGKYITGCSQSSTGAINCAKVGSASAVASRYLSWINQKD
jgi:type IV pilus assembly protein PilY1